MSADNLPEQNLLRAMQLTDAAVENYFEGNNMTLAEKYNPYTDAREGTGSVWVYTSCIEAVNAVIDGLKTSATGATQRSTTSTTPAMRSCSTNSTSTPDSTAAPSR